MAQTFCTALTHLHEMCENFISTEKTYCVDCSTKLKPSKYILVYKLKIFVYTILFFFINVVIILLYFHCVCVCVCMSYFI